MPAIDLFVRFAAGPHVLKKAHSKLRTRTSKNWPHGKKISTLACKNRLNYSSIVYPTMTPISTPRQQELRTKTKAS